MAQDKEPAKKEDSKPQGLPVKPSQPNNPIHVRGTDETSPKIQTKVIKKQSE